MFSDIRKGNVLAHAMKAKRQRKCIAPLILNLGTRWRLIVNFTPWQLYAQKRTLVPTE
jgi:hypothetical protein